MSSWYPESTFSETTREEEGFGMEKSYLSFPRLTRVQIETKKMLTESLKSVLRYEVHNTGLGRAQQSYHKRIT